LITIQKIENTNGEVYAVLQYEPDKNYLLMKWIGYCTEEEMQSATLRMLDWQRREGRQKHCHFHVHDTKELEGAWVGVVDWIRNEFFPQCYEAGLRYNISVLSPDLFSKLSSEALFHRSSAKVPTLLFETLSQAERWLTAKYHEL
jgi:hypothetical protein